MRVSIVSEIERKNIALLVHLVEAGEEIGKLKHQLEKLEKENKGLRAKVKKYWTDREYLERLEAKLKKESEL
jgi:cell division protein FtsB